MLTLESWDIQVCDNETLLFTAKGLQVLHDGLDQPDGPTRLDLEKMVVQLCEKFIHQHQIPFDLPAIATGNATIGAEMNTQRCVLVSSKVVDDLSAIDQKSIHILAAKNPLNF